MQQELGKTESSPILSGDWIVLRRKTASSDGPGCYCWWVAPSRCLGARGVGVHESIDTKDIVLRDSKGRLALHIGTSPLDDMATLNFFDRDGVDSTLCGHSLFFTRIREGVSQQTYFGADSKGNSRFIFRDNDGHVGCALGIADRRVPYLQFEDRNDHLRMQIALDPEAGDSSSYTFSTRMNSSVWGLK